MKTDRRGFLAGALTAAVGTTASGRRALAAKKGAAVAPAASDVSTWAGVRNEFLLSRDFVHMAQLLLASHPRPVREAIERHRRGFDENPVTYFHDNVAKAETEMRGEA